MGKTQVAEEMAMGIRFDIDEEHLHQCPDDLNAGVIVHTGNLGKSLTVALTVNGDKEEKYFEAVLYVDGEERGFSDPIYDGLNTVGGVKSTIIEAAKTFFDFSEITIQQNGFLTKDEPYLHYHTKETLAIYEKGLVLSEEENLGDYRNVLLSDGVCEAAFWHRRDKFLYAVELQRVDPLQVTEGLYKVAYGLKEMTSELLEIIDELENSGHYDYDEIVELEEKRDHLRSAIQEELAKNN